MKRLIDALVEKLYDWQTRRILKRGLSLRNRAFGVRRKDHAEMINGSPA